jgi:uncharacterized protein (DUF433 family)
MLVQQSGVRSLDFVRYWVIGAGQGTPTTDVNQLALAFANSWERFSRRRKQSQRNCLGNAFPVLAYSKKRSEIMPTGTLDWSQCPAVESVPGKVSGAWVFKDTRMPVSIVFENLESGATIEEIMEWFHVTREQIVSVLEFAARSLDVPSPVTSSNQPMVDARSL